MVWVWTVDWIVVGGGVVDCGFWFEVGVDSVVYGWFSGHWAVDWWCFLFLDVRLVFGLLWVGFCCWVFWLSGFVV